MESFVKKCKGIATRIKWGNVFFFLLYFLLQFKAINQNYFDTDEFDIFVGGEAICRGAWLYRDFLSQHMPFSYYISAFFWFLGAQSVLLQRTYFYAAFSGIWVYISNRYSSIVNKKALRLFPVLFIFLINYISWGTSILSEHMNAIGVVFFILEYRLFLVNGMKKISLSSSIILSSAILLTFGTTFVSAFLVFAVVLMVIYSEICIVRKERIKRKELFSYFRDKYATLVICCVAPWVVLCVIYLIGGVMDDFYYGAYYMNVDIYSQYNGGYGDNILYSACSGIKYMADYSINTVTAVMTGAFDARSVILLISLCIAGMFIVLHAIRGNITESVLWFLMLIVSGTRGVFNFHSTHLTAMVALLCAMWFFDDENKGAVEKNNSYMSSVSRVAVFFVIGSVYLSDTSAFFSINLNWESTEDSKIIRELTHEDEGIWACELGNNSSYIDSGRYPYKVLNVPWFWDAYGKDVLEEFGNNPPRLCLFNENSEVWGRNVNDYAPELVSYINDFYLPYTSDLYIRKDYYDEAVEIIKENLMCVSDVHMPDNDTVELTLENPTEVFTAVQFAVWSDENGQDDLVWYEGVLNEECQWSCEIKKSNHQSYGRYSVHVYATTEEDGTSLVATRYIFIEDMNAINIDAVLDNNYEAVDYALEYSA